MRPLVRARWSHTVDVAQPGPLPPLCIAVGGVVRLVHSGPGSLVAQPSTSVNCFYAAGIHQCRLIRTGTVRFTLAADARVLTVQVPAAVPGAALDGLLTEGQLGPDFDTNEEMPRWSPCLRVGATLRVVNLGPGLLKVTPGRRGDLLLRGRHPRLPVPPAGERRLHGHPGLDQSLRDGRGSPLAVRGLVALAPTTAAASGLRARALR